ncbi:ABC transporter permease/substrate-binding protein [Helcococcus kunzii]|uniref:ABC transporter permease/substrate-binding protein n=1 Tax=Helcococcus kunzii TaxID=40091 RepID=UPI0024AD2DCB|nr:ABC transporter permease/substrate-binding protein [Helcococcus kunzii]
MLNNLEKTFVERYSDWTKALVEHLQISMLALFIAIIIAVPFAILISKNRKLSEISLQITGVLQTVPSLALLGLFIPFLGIGRLPAIVALVIYGIFPILQNTITGLIGINPVLQEAATAFGMNRMEKLKKYEIPLAMPSIIGGIRTSSVMLIGTATLAALVGAGGLGSFILLGIDRNNSSLILIGAISSAILAVIFNYLIKKLENKKVKTILISFVVSLSILLVSMFNFGTMASKKIVAAGKLGSEPEILINMYKELIEDKTDISVEVKPSFGKTTFLFEALKKGSIDVYPEFTGTITSSLLKEKVKGLSNDEREVYEAARDNIYKQDKLVLLEPMIYQNTYAIAVKKQYAKENGLKKISDLKKVENKAKAGFTLEFNDREDGNKGLKKLYGLNLNVATMEPKLRYQALEKGDINILEIYSTDTEIISRDLVILEDDKGLFPPYQGAPLLREETLEKYPELKEILEQISNKITTEEMLEMNYKVDVEGKSANEVAVEYLKSKNLLSK